MMRSKTPISANPGRPLASPARDARELLLTAATELFAEQGVAATTFANIARRARLTPAMLHYYFKDREELLDVVVEERLCPLLAYVWGPVTEGDDPGAIIRGIVQRLLEGIGRMPWVPSTWMREILNEDGLLRERILRHLPYEKLRFLSAAIARGQAGGALNPDLDARLMVFSTLGLVMVHMATVKVWAEIFHTTPLNREVVGRHITGLLMNGLRRKVDTPRGGEVRKHKKHK